MVLLRKGCVFPDELQAAIITVNQALLPCPLAVIMTWGPEKGREVQKAGAEERKCTGTRRPGVGSGGGCDLRMRVLGFGYSLTSLMPLLFQPALPVPELPGPTHCLWALC